MTALNRKLRRDLWRMRGQAFAIAMVVAAGVSLYVTYLSNFESLRRTQQTYYQQQRFGDVFASLKRAPESVAALLREIPGVSAVETRVVADVELDFPELNQPVTARLVSVPADRRPMLNDLYLRRGRWIDPNRSDEVLVTEAFVEAHDLQLGDTLTALINGRLRTLRIAGVALSPEYIYTTTRGEIVPDDKRFGVIWMDERALAAAFDMQGAFNDVVMAVGPGEDPARVIASTDTLLERYGGFGAIPRALQFSHWTLENELLQLESFGLLLPMIFLLVAAFVLNVALGRALSLQRPQIAALKALGYSNRQLAWHYTKWALAVGIAGLLIGIAAGAWLGEMVAGIYNRYFKFPELAFAVPLRTALGATALTLVAATGGAYAAVRRAVGIPPAEAMRPEPPARFHKTIFETRLIAAELGAVGRMVVRNISRHPLRAAASIFGIASAVSLLMVGMVLFDAMDHLIDTQFWVMQRQDAAIGFVEPRSSRVRYELAHLPGVLAVEPRRTVAVRVRAGHRDRYLAITGIDRRAQLQRIVGGDGQAYAVPASGVAMSAALGKVLQVNAGDELVVDVLEGERRTHRLRVNALVDDVLGLTLYMDIDALHRLMREGETASGAMLLFDQQYADALLRRLKSMPGVAGVSLKRSVLKAFRDTMAATMNVTIAVNLIFASIIAVGVVYNAARVALSERSHELASLRVLGYTRAEISMILLSELAVLTVAALPAGWLLGYGLSAAVFSTVQSEVYRFPLYVSRQAITWASLGILGAALIAGLIVRRRLDHLDLVAVLKVRE